MRRGRIKHAGSFALLLLAVLANGNAQKKSIRNGAPPHRKARVAHLTPPQLAPYSFTLEQTARELGLPAGLGRAEGFVAKLERGEPVTIAILGASVAENAGCLSQPGKRCMRNRGAEPIRMVWGEPRSRPFKGFAVRFFEWMNATWPHPQHQLFNAARDASSLATIVPCLFSHLPQRFDLLLMEAGSMFETTKSYTIETLTRQVLSMRFPPAIAFVTVHLWCTFGGSLRKRVVSYGLNKLPSREYHFWPGAHPHANRSVEIADGPSVMRNPSDVLENNITAICRLYGLGCISQRDALMPQIASLDIEEVAGDCLHPVHGSKGTDFMADLLVHWTMRVVERYRSAAAEGRSSSRNILPYPIHPKQVLRAQSEKAACYHLAEGMGREAPSNLASLPWHTAACPADRASDSSQLAGCSNKDESMSCPSAYHPLGGGGAKLPTVWVYCSHSIGGAKKPSPGVVALQPGATLLIPLPTDWLTSSLGSSHSRQAASSSVKTVHFNATLQYLISWHLMGRVRIACTESCACTTHELDAHVSSWTRNSTIYTEHRFPMSLTRHEELAGDTTARCGLALTVLPTSSSGGHMFRVRDVILYTSASPCDQKDGKQRVFLKRSKLKCARDEEDQERPHRRLRAFDDDDPPAGAYSAVPPFQAAATCLAHGHGSWQPTTAAEPYLVETDRYLPGFNTSVGFWGRADDDVRRSVWEGKPRRPPRAELGFEWQPEGAGCNAILRSSKLPSREELVGEFCKRWSGQTILFVGDSISATSFTSFAHLVGFINTTSNSKNPCYRRKKLYGPAGAGAQEIDLTVQLCEPAPGGVLAKFLRNEDLDVTGWAAEKADGGDGKIVGAGMNCYWERAFDAANFTVMNTGLHHHGRLDEYLNRVNRTFARVAKSITQRGSKVSRHTLYRSSWSALIGCNDMKDPLPPQEAIKMLMDQTRRAGSGEDRYNWTDLSPQNVGARALAEQYGIPYWETFEATSMRPGGHRVQAGPHGPSSDCVHYYLPGPPDWLNLQLLAYLNLVPRRRPH